MPSKSQEIKVARIFENLPGQFRLRGRKRSVKVDQGSPLSLIEATLDLVDKNISAPTIVRSCSGYRSP